ncbi:stage II sporulation protein D [Bacillaceae bacterium S4-13-56]
MKKPGFILVGLILLTILLIPTFIVIPFVDSGEREVEVAQNENKPVTLDIDSDIDVKVWRASASVAETVPIEEYVVGVVASEMPADFEMEALKAQALAARTYIVKYMINQEEPVNESGAQVTDTIEHQVYKNEDDLRETFGKDYNWKMERIIEAVRATKGKIITYDGEPIDASFFSTSNGFTENSEDYWANELPYLRSVASPWDEESPKFLDQTIVPRAKVAEKLGVPLASPLKVTISKTEGNRVETIEIGGETFTGRDIRDMFDLRSSDFTMEEKDDYIIFKTKGYGHGVGMSQYGANGMAKEGKTYEEIIHYFYKGVEISNLKEHEAEITKEEV